MRGVLMTNHIHLIVGRNGENKIDEIIRDFKKFTSVHICRAIENNNTSESLRTWMLRFKFWQNEYHPIELSSNAVMDQKLEYIHNNPIKDGIVEELKIIFIAVQDYAGMKGLLQIEFMD